MNIARCFIFLCISLGSSVYAQDWIPFQGHNPPVIINQQHTIPIYQPVIVYQWVPYTVQQNIIVEQKYLLCKKQTVITQPVTQWIYQPVILYR